MTSSGPLAARGAATLQRAIGNRATGAVLQRERTLVIQRDDYPYGGPNVVPHIHRYAKGAHLKILDGSAVKRLNLVQGGVRYRENVMEAFALARAAGNAALVAAIKEVIRGVGPFGRPGSLQRK